jgi:tetratricopeptide (TPR) repeat protein
MRSDILDTLANQLLLRFHDIGDPSLLCEAVERGKQSLHLCAPSHPKRYRALATLAIILREFRLYTAENDAMLDEAVSYAKEAVALCAINTPDRHLPLIALSLVLRDLHRRSKGEVPISQALQLAQEATSLCECGHPDRDRAVEALSFALYDDWVLRSERELLQRTILLSREVLELRPEGHKLRCRAIITLVESLAQEYKQDGDRTLLQEYVSLAREAVALRPKPHNLRTTSLNTLANALRDEFMITDDETAISESDQLRFEAISLLPQNHPSRNNALVGFSLGLYERHLRTGAISLLDEAIRLAEDARSSDRVGREHHIVLGNLSAMLVSRFDCLGDIASLDAAARTSEEALELRPPGHPFRVYSLYQMGAIAQKRASVAEKASILSESNRWLQEALDLCSTNHPLRGHLQDALARNLCDQYVDDRDPEKNDRAIVLFREALQAHSPGDPQHRGNLANLGRAVFQKYQLSKKEEFFQEATSLLNSALELSPEGVRDRFLIFSRLCESYFDPSPHFDMTFALEYFREVINDPYAPPRVRLVEARKLLDKMHNVICSSVAATISSFGPMILRAYQDTVALLPLVANFGLDHAARLRELALVQSLSSNGATFAISLNEGCTALEILEDSRAVFWSQALRLRDACFDDLPTERAQELDGIFKALSRGSDVDSSDYLNPELVKLRRQSERAQEIINEIRQSSPKFERFLLGHTFASLARAASKGPVVVLTSNHYGCNALVLLNAAGEWMRISLPDTSELLLKKLSAQTRDLGNSRGVEEDNDANVSGSSGERAVLIKQRARQNSIVTSSVLEELWFQIVKPIIEGIGLQVRPFSHQLQSFKQTITQKNHSRKRKRLYWCPTGSFSFVPLHAAGIYHGDNQIGCSDFVISSYTPTLTALVKAQDNWVSLHKSSLSALIVAETSAPGMSRIPHAEREAVVVADTLAGAAPALQCYVAGVGSTAGTLLSTVLEKLELVNMVHFACHGQQHPADPLESGFKLRDGALTVSALMRLKLPHAQFAFLSACETAQGDKNQPDQMIHLAAAMLFTGFNSVIGTMWSVYSPVECLNSYQLF